MVYRSPSTKSFLLCSHKGLKHVGTNKRKELDEQSKPITSSLDGSAVSVHQMRKMYPENIDQNLAAKLVAQEYLNVSSVFFFFFSASVRPSRAGRAPRWDVLA